MFFITVNGSLTLKFNLYAAKNLKHLILAGIGKKSAHGGCYVYFNAQNEPLYVGKSRDLANRLTQQGTPRGIEYFFDWAYLGVVYSDDPHLTEQLLIQQLQPLHNKIGKNDRTENFTKQKEN
jgi:excinuclease UvrABC nuclease subunit